LKKVIAISNLAYLGYSIDTAIEEIQKLGVEYIELAFLTALERRCSNDFFSAENAHTIKKKLIDHNLRIQSLSAHMDLGKKNAPESFKKRMDFASALEVLKINTHLTTKDNSERFFLNIETVSQYAEQIGLTICLENTGNYNELFVSGNEGKSIVERIGSDNVRVNYDFGNIITSTKARISPAEDFLKIIPYTVQYHLKDIGRVNGMFEVTGIGNGMIDYKKIFQIIEKLNINLPMTIELPFRLKWDAQFRRTLSGPPPPLSDIRSILMKSVKYVQENSR